MAVDTRNKRASAIMLSLYWRNLLPVPNASSDTAAERAQLAAMYSGLENSWTPVPPGPGGSWSAVSGGPAGGWTSVPAGPSGGWVPV